MFFSFKKQTVYNTVFAFGLILSFISVFALYTQNNHSAVVSGTVLTGKVVVIDAGHGSPDSGAIGFSGTKEKDLNLEIAKKLGTYLKKYGANVIYTRENDSAIVSRADNLSGSVKLNDLKKRKVIRDSSQADLFISIHMNIFTEKKYSGAQVFYSGDHVQSKILAESIQASLKNFVNYKNNRTAKESKSIYILKGCQIPSVLVECGFISNPDEEKKLISQNYQEDVAYAISAGIIKYLSNT